MRILFDSKNEYHKTPFGCLKQDEKCTMRIDVPTSCETVLVRLILKSEDGFELKLPFEKEKCENGYDTFVAQFSLFKTGLYFYYFDITTKNSGFDLYKQGNDTNICVGDLWQLTCYDKDYDTPKDFKGRVMYQIFPDRFNKLGEPDLKDKLQPFFIHENLNDIPVYTPDYKGEVLNNDFFGGNLEGITQKLSYLKELGVGIIYLNPIFYAFSNHRYDTADYKRIDPMLGNEEDFKRLCDEAHKLDIKIILDGVFSHTGSNSIYFDKEHVFGNGACSDENSPYRPWYNFESYPEKYEAWWGIKTLPCVNELNTSYMDYIINAPDSVVCHWMSLGADGFRLDVADELPDEFIYALKKKLKELNSDAFLIGEVWEDASNKISYGKRRRYFSDSELDSVMNYPFRDAILNFVKGNMSGEDFGKVIMDIAENYPKPVLDCLMNLLSTHDTPRIITELSGRCISDKNDRANFKLMENELENCINFAKIASILQFTLPGNPSIYYGDEIGMQGYEDPFNRAFFDWSMTENDMHLFYKGLSALKNNNKALKYGDIRVCEMGDRYIKFVRRYQEFKTCVEISLNGKLEKENKIFAFEYGSVNAIVYEI